MRTDKIRKYLILNIPYLFILWAFLKLGTAYRLAAGNDFAHKLMGLGQTIGPAFADFAPGLAPLDWLVGIVGAIVFRLLIYFKSKNAKKFRRDAEYGSARWGTEKDIKPFVDPRFENNVILTGTEFLTMNTRPKIPANARNLNCCIIGSSGSGKSTLMRHIAGLMPGDAGGGRIEVAQHLIQDRGVISRDIRTMRAEIGMVFQQFNLVDRMAVLRNVMLGALSRTALWRSLLGFFHEEDARLAYKALARMIDYVIDGGVDYIVALGTTAETPTLYMPERAVIAMFITNHIAGRVPLVMGCGGNSTSEVLDQLREFDLRGADAILSVTPYYNKPSQEGLYQHFRTVSEHSPLPVILYNIPGRSGVNMTAETTLRCAADFRNVIGIKEASGDIGQMQRILDNRPEGFLVLSGDDGMTLELMRRGGDGVISVAANAFPKRFMECVNYAKAGEFDRAEKAYECLDEAVHALFEEGNPVGVKCALAEMGIIGPTMRLPLVEGSGALREKFRKLIAEYDLR